MSMTLQTERLILRRPEPGDYGAYRSFMTSDRSTWVGGPMTMGEAWRAFATELGHWELFGYGMWAVTVRGDNDAVGLVGPWTPEDWPETEIGWLILDPKIEGTGIAFEAAKAAIAHAFDALNWRTAVSYIAPDNVRSIALAQKLGGRLDINATAPKSHGDCLVYRHPDPEGQRR
jgi:RimJ/RimL family protein N-acetyltransferase